MKLLGFGGFSTSSIRKSIEDGDFSGWDDPRLPTVSALRRRGILPQALREFWIELRFDPEGHFNTMESIESKNSKIIDRYSERRSFIESPRELQLIGDGNTDTMGLISIKRHPDIRNGN